MIDGIKPCDHHRCLRTRGVPLGHSNDRSQMPIRRAMRPMWGGNQALHPPHPLRVRIKSQKRKATSPSTLQKRITVLMTEVERPGNTQVLLDHPRFGQKYGPQSNTKKENGTLLNGRLNVTSIRPIGGENLLQQRRQPRQPKMMGRTRKITFIDLWQLWVAHYDQRRTDHSILMV